MKILRKLMNFNLDLTPKRMDLLDYLEKETKISKESYLNDLINDKND